MKYIVQEKMNMAIVLNIKIMKSKTLELKGINGFIIDNKGQLGINHVVLLIFNYFM